MVCVPLIFDRLSDLEEICRAACEELSRTVSADTAFVWLRDGDGPGGLTVQARRGCAPVQARRESLFSGRPFLEEGRPRVVRGTEALAYLSGLELAADAPKALALAGLAWDGQPFGLLGVGYAEERQEIPPEELGLIQANAEAASAAIARVQGFKTLEKEQVIEQLASALTGLALSGQSFKDALEHMAGRIVELLDAEGCTISLWDPRHALLSPSAICKREIQPGGEHPETVIIDLALQSEERKVGALQIALHPLHPLRAGSWAGWVTLAHQTTLAIAYLQSIELEKKRSLEAKLLQQATVAIASSLDLEVVLSQILTSLEQEVPYDSAAICLIEKETLRIAAQGGLPWHARKVGERIAKSSGLFSLLEGALAPVYLADAQQHSSYVDWSQRGDFDIHGWMGVPLIVNDRPIAYLLLNSRETDVYTPDHARLAQAFASHAAAAIEKARLFEQVLNGRERMRRLSKKLVQMQEDERRFIAHELHDAIGQELTGLQFVLDAGKEGTQASRLEAITVSQGLVEELKAKIHELSVNLHPSTIDERGLLPTLKSFFGRFEQKYGIRARFFHQNLERRFPAEVEVSAFRVVQEAATNIARYAGVKELEVIISADETALTILVADHGQGFDPQLVEGTSRSFGISGMRERTELAGGTFELFSQPGAGTRITAVFPLGPKPERIKRGRTQQAGGGGRFGAG